LIEDVFVIDATVHHYNLSPQNVRGRFGAWVRDSLVHFHPLWQPTGVSVGPELLESDWSVDTLARTLFLESPVDLAVTHTLRLDSYFVDGLGPHRKTVDAVRKYPTRFLGYVGLDPTLGCDRCLRDLEIQLEELPTAVGIKLYPAQVDPIRSFRMDDPALMFPVYKRAQELGIKVIACHKASPVGPVPFAPFHVDDLQGAAHAFPDLQFEIVHAGGAFNEEIALTLARFPNVYGNLEVNASFSVVAPGVFEEALAQLLFWGGPEKIIYADGSMILHSRPVVDAIWNFQFSEETLRKYRLSPLTKADKALILGGNYARMISLDIEQLQSGIADDQFSRELSRTGMQEPYSNWKSSS
jgi:predicted TIM-barrel fold metal-dependent hydrolase